MKVKKRKEYEIIALNASKKQSKFNLIVEGERVKQFYCGSKQGVHEKWLS